MATTYTNILRLAKPTQGELDGTWGNVVNDNITEMVEEAVAGLATIDTWTTNSHTLTTSNGTTDESRCAILVLTDTTVDLSGSGTLIVPDATKLYVVYNNTGQTITVKTSAGTGVAVVDGNRQFVYCDATNVEVAITESVTATETAEGIVELATQDEVNAGTDTARVVTPATLSSYSGLFVGNLAGLGDVTITSVTNDEVLQYTGAAWENQTLAEAGIAPVATPTFTGTVTIPTADINGGNIDATTIGAATAAAGDFTTVTASTYSGLPVASDSVQGIVELATQAEADAGFDTGRAITPDTLNGYGGDLEALDIVKATAYHQTAASLSGTTPSMDCSTASYFYITLTGNTTFSFANVPGTGNVYTCRLEVTQDGASVYTMTFPGTVTWNGGAEPTDPATSTIAVYELFTRDGGTSWIGAIVMDE
jgi:hypothetical protein